MLEIVLRVQIGNEPRLNRSPSQPFLRQCGGSRAVHTKEASNPAKMIGCLLARLADDRHVQTPSDDLSDLSSRYALIGHTVVPCTSRFSLEREPIEMSSIEPVHRGPAVEPIPDICGNALFACDADQPWYKAVIAVAMDRRREPHYGCLDSARRQRKPRLLRLAGEVGSVCILFCCE